MRPFPTHKKAPADIASAGATFSEKTKSNFTFLTNDSQKGSEAPHIVKGAFVFVFIVGRLAIIDRPDCK